MLEHSDPQPVPISAYQALKEVNGSFKQMSRSLHALEQFNFFPAANLTAWLNLMDRTRAEISLKLIECLSSREMANAEFYDGACLRRERELRDPDDVLLDAEARKRQIAQEEQNQQRDTVVDLT